jgi:hypothetical protein
MKITNTILSIPPYISTSWDKIATIHVSEGEVHVHLKDGSKVVLHNLPADVVEQIFSFHAQALEKQQMARPLGEMTLSRMHLPFGPLEAMSQMLQHNPKQADLPPIPEEAVGKISQMAKMLSAEEIQAMPPPEPDCHCLYCQISGILHQAIDLKVPEKEEEVVSDEELQFEEWDIKPVAEKLYLVTNKLNPQEQYQVFLGDPIGCTCGKIGCEHMLAVLRH